MCLRRPGCHSSLRKNPRVVPKNRSAQRAGASERSEEVGLISTPYRYTTIEMASLIRPHTPIPEQATAIHGITNDMVSTAPTFKQVWPLLYPLLCLYKVVVYNAPYDMSIIKRLSLSERYTSKNVYADCAMRAYSAYFQEPGFYENGFKWHKLEVACEHLSVEIDGNSHRSLTDCTSTLGIIRKLRTLYDNRLVEIGA